MNSRSHSKYILKDPRFETRSVPRPPLECVLGSEGSHQCEWGVGGLQRVFKSTSGWLC